MLAPLPTSVTVAPQRRLASLEPPQLFAGQSKNRHAKQQYRVSILRRLDSTINYGWGIGITLAYCQGRSKIY